MNAPLISREQSSHWYRKEGDQMLPCHELPKKTGGGMKAVTLREARELNLWPSVTNILGIVAKPELNAWKQEQAILAALSLPRKDGELLDVFAKRVVEDMEQQAAEARKFGQEIHQAAADWLQSGDLKAAILVHPYLQSFRDWARTNIEEVLLCESCVGAAGYAGRLDLYCRLKDIGLAVVDFKTQRVKNGKAGFYLEWARQLAAYADCVRTENMAKLVSVVIDSGKPAEIQTKQWDDPHRHLVMFHHCFELWKDEKGYDPIAIPQLL